MTELQNCLEEAKIAYAMKVAPEPTGDGPFTVREFEFYYCKSTDAFAGEYLSRVSRFPTREEAESYASKALFDSYGEVRTEVLPALPKAEPLPVVALEEGEEVSF